MGTDNEEKMKTELNKEPSLALGGAVTGQLFDHAGACVCIPNDTPANSKNQEPILTDICEVCGSSPAMLTADPDKGGLHLCAVCQWLFGFVQGGGDGTNH
jgi:hypothetical protein